MRLNSRKTRLSKKETVNLFHEIVFIPANKLNFSG